MDEEEDTNHLKLTLSQKGFSHAGILESVQLDRFMSHYCFEYKLGRNINIVNGPNGSGKSAIVAALQIGLGARASATERGSKIEDHIMHGQNSAVITIRIHNAKPPNGDMDHDNSFKWERYKDKIIIERKLVRKGAATYDVRDAYGKRIRMEPGETARSEVRDIVDHFGFMVDNPVAILTQTKSKAFLAKCRGTEHYKLYKEATLLGPLEEELIATKQVAKELKEDIIRKKSDIPCAEKRVVSLEREYKEAQEMKNIDQRVADTELMFAWTIHDEVENEIDHMQRKFDASFVPAAKEAEEDWNEAREVVQKLSAEIKELSDTAALKTVERDELFRAAKDAKRQVKQQQFEVDRHRNKAGECDADIHDSTRKINDLESDLKRKKLEHLESQKQKDEMTRKLQEAEQKVQELQQQVETERQRETEAHRRMYEDREQIPRAKSERDRVARELENRKNELMGIQGAAQGDRALIRFGKDFVELARRLDRVRRRFEIPPIGPLGVHIKVQDDAWTPAVEACLGRGTLESYIVHSSRDSRLLQEQLRGLRITPTIVVRDLRRRRYQIGDGDRPHVRLPGHRRFLLMELLTFDNDAVFNTLIDSKNIEQLVMVGKKEDGQLEDITRLGWDRSQSQIKAVWNDRGEHAYRRGGANTFRRASPNFGRNLLLSRDLSSYLQWLQSEVGRVQAKYNELNAGVREVEQKARNTEREYAVANQRSKQISMELNTARNNVNRHNDMLSQAAQAFDSEPFEREIQQLKQQISDDKVTKEKELKWVEDAQRKMGELREQETVSVGKMKKLDDECQELGAKVENMNGKLSRERGNMLVLKSKWQKADHKLKLGQQEIAAKRDEAMKKMADAQQFGNRPNNVDSKKIPSSRISRELNVLRERMHTEQERRGGKSTAEIEREYLVAKGKFDETKKLLSRIESYDLALQQGLERRLEQRKQLDKVLKRHVRNHFASFLNVRGHTGELKFKKNENDVMELTIATRMASHKRADGETYKTKDLRSLSGGERSFTTLAFMLALAEVCNNPIRVMDEIDVFQDEANRRASFKTLINYCSSYLTDKQFIIITPLSLPDVDPTEHVRIVRLAAPRAETGRHRQSTIDQYAGRN